jgi:hypothetical protein
MMATRESSKGKQNQGAPTDEDQQLHDAPPQTSRGAADTKAADASADDQQKINTLTDALQGDLTAIDIEAAFGLIDEWYGSLNKSKDADLKEIAQSLKELKQLLKSGKASGHEIGEVLSELGGQTANVASDADAGFKTPLQKLGKFLGKAGTSIGRAEDQENVEQIDSLVETLGGEDLTSIDSDTSIGAIDHWYAQLHKSEDEQIQAIANDLKQLKQVLKRSKPKGSDIAEVLTRLGQQTVEAAASAPRGFKGHIQRLGKTLSRVGQSIE